MHARAPCAGVTTDREVFFDLSLDLLCIAGTDGVFKDLSPSWTRTLGWSLDELRSRPFVEFVHPDDRERTLSEAAALAEGVLSIRFENRYRHKDGSWRWLQWNGNLRPERGLFYAVARDITAQKEAAQRIGEKVEELRRVEVQAGATPVRTRLQDLRASLEAVQRQLRATPA